MKAPQQWAQLLEFASGQPERPALSLSDALALSSDIGPEVLGCSVTEMAGPNYQTPANSSELALLLDLAQYAAGSGPCVAAARDRQPQQLDDLNEDRRFPHFSTEAIQRGVQSSFSVPLAGTFRPAAMNLYADRAGLFTEPRARSIALLLARSVSVLMGGQPRSPGAFERTESEELCAARASGEQVARARDALGEREHLDRRAAHLRLIERARNERRPLSVTAAITLSELGLGGDR
ncbi:MAG: uncharacterized protein JWO63_282 [Frankiales bacterium]|nr:uncharacterized protein [Frankiales bacterium]